MSNLKFYSLLAALAAMAVSFSVAVWHYLPMPTTPPPFNTDSAYVDSLMQDHHQAPSFISSDTADSSTQRVYDSSVRAEYPPSFCWSDVQADEMNTNPSAPGYAIFQRLLRLQDSLTRLAVAAAYGRVTEEECESAYRVLAKYFFEVYLPLKVKQNQ